jgi:hypothetical protein
MENNDSATKITWIVVIITVIIVVGLGIYAATGLNYSFPNITHLLPL